MVGLAKYKFIYDNGVIQYKDLIPHHEWVEYRKKESNLVETIKNSKELENEISIIKKDFKNKYGDNWFTDESPLYRAFLTGILEIQNNKSLPCKVEKI